MPSPFSRPSFRWPREVGQAAPSPEDRGQGRFERLVDAHLDAIYRTARRLGVRAEDIDDLVQDVLIVLARRLADIEEAKERAFALGTTARLAMGLRRKALQRREALVGELDEMDHANFVSPFGCSTELRADGTSSLERAEALALLRAGLDAMTEAQRVTFVLFELEELRASEIAAQLGVAEAAVVSRLHRARSVMRRVCARRRLTADTTTTELEGEREP